MLELDAHGAQTLFNTSTGFVQGCQLVSSRVHTPRLRLVSQIIPSMGGARDLCSPTGHTDESRDVNELRTAFSQTTVESRQTGMEDLINKSQAADAGRQQGGMTRVASVSLSAGSLIQTCARLFMGRMDYFHQL